MSYRKKFADTLAFIQVLASLIHNNFYAVILVWPLWFRIPDSLPTKVVNYVVLCIVLCKCVLHYFHRVSTQLQLTNISNITYYQVIFVSESLFVLPKLIHILPKAVLFLSQRLDINSLGPPYVVY